MLTDYHVHLRPDDVEATAARYLTAANAERYRTVASERGITELGVAEHVYRFRQALDVWRHPFWQRYAHDDLDAYCAFVREETDLRLGIEADFIPGAEDRMANLLDGRPWDYVVGSVHFLRDRAIDVDEWDVWEGAADPDRVWRRYFETLAEAARSGLYDLLAHPDLVKVWGERRPRPEGDLRRFYEPAVEAMAETGVAVEVSSAGWRKPVGELYPAPAPTRSSSCAARSPWRPTRASTSPTSTPPSCWSALAWPSIATRCAPTSPPRWASTSPGSTSRPRAARAWASSDAGRAPPRWRSSPWATDPADYSGQKSGTVSTSARTSSTRIETSSTSATSGPSLWMERTHCGAIRTTPPGPSSTTSSSSLACICKDITQSTASRVTT